MTMRMFRGAALAAVAMVLVPAAAQAAPTVVGGTFETPTVGGGYAYGTDPRFNAGSGVQGNGSDWGFADAPEGVQTAFLQSFPNTIGQIALSLTDLVAGQAYKVSFFGSARPNYASNAFTVSADGTTIGSYNLTDNNWQSLTTRAFTASGTTGTLTFLGSPTTNGDNDVGLDGITISAVPEPATWAMMILGMGMIGFAMRRRTKTSVAFA